MTEQSQVTPFVGYAPDLDTSTPGVIVACQQIIPTINGMQAAPSPNAVTTLGALSATCLGSFSGAQLDGTYRFVAGTASALYESVSGSYSNISKSGGYTASGKWRYAMFGNHLIAANLSTVLQFSGSSGALMANLSADAPQAAIIETCLGFVLAFNTISAQNGTNTNGWAVSALYNDQSWTASLATQAAYGTLVDTPGPITAAKRLGNTVIVYKLDSLYVGTYQGPPVIWGFQPIPGFIGTWCQESVVSVQNVHYFIGHYDFYIYDGTTPRSLNSPLREWFFATLNPTYAGNIWSVLDTQNDLIYWYFPSASSSGPCDSCIVYNYRLNLWGRADQLIECASQYATTALTYTQFGALFNEYVNLPLIPYNSSFFFGGSLTPAVFTTAHQVSTLNGTPGNWSITTGDNGDVQTWMFLGRVSPKWSIAPAGTVNYTNYYRLTLGDTPISDTSLPMDAYRRFNMLRSAHWHSITFSGAGNMAVRGLDWQMRPLSNE